MGSIDWNLRTWDDPANWSEFGDGWTFHAADCGQPYDKWKDSVVANFLNPFIDPKTDTVEIAPGHGRWTEFMVGHVGTLTLVDLSPTCIAECRARFAEGHPEISFLVNDGKSIDVGDESVDLIWSFSSFVHIDEPEIRAYLDEFRRVLRPGGRFVVHHAGWTDWTLGLVPLTDRLGRPGRALIHRLAQGRWRRAGDRSPMSAERFARLTADSGLVVHSQVDRWGEQGQFSVTFRDVVTLGSRPAVDPGVRDDGAGVRPSEAGATHEPPVAVPLGTAGRARHRRARQRAVRT